MFSSFCVLKFDVLFIEIVILWVITLSFVAFFFLEHLGITFHLLTTLFG